MGYNNNNNNNNNKNNNNIELEEIGKSGYQCRVPLRCLNGICVENVGINETCEFNSDCDQNLGAYCVWANGTKTCQLARYAEYGEACTRSYQCAYDLECIDNLCVTPSNGCVVNSQCNSTSYCQNYTCIQADLKDNECVIYGTIPYCSKVLGNFSFCALQSLNNTNIGVCKEVIEEGTPCLVNKFICDIRSNQYCDPIQKGSLLGICKNSPTPMFNPCSTQADCNNWEFCKCDRNTGVGYCTSRGVLIGSLCQRSIEIFINCFAKSGCSSFFNSNPNSCTYSRCFQETNCVINYCIEPLMSVTPSQVMEL
eukprot:gene9904-12147_t